jgi:transcriptional regulator with PAS, ATPase and Fis domain
VAIPDLGTAGIELPPFGDAAEDLVTSILDSIPCGVLVVDQRRRIRAVNEAFRRALRIDDSRCLGNCQGSVLGCLHAVEEEHHQNPPAMCRECELAALTSEAFEHERRVRGRATLQVTTECRLQDITLECTAVPVTVGAERFAIVLIESTDELRGLRSGDVDGATFGMVGRDPSMLELYYVIREVGPLDVPVLIQGESGTGKELVARALHRISPRAERLLVPVNCGALPDGLLESELFGHVRGAFTGAHRDKQGRFELADGGTIFLDEIGELSSAMQVKFLRVLQGGSFEPVGGERTISVDTRVLCATNRDLEADVADGRFRTDLYYRLCVVPITVPPLRERSADIPRLAEHFLAQFLAEHPALHTKLSDEALETLSAHRWPGNVRELENAIQYAAIRARGDVIECRHLPPNLDHRCARTVVGRPALTLDRDSVRQALSECDGNRGEAANLLGVSRTTLWRFLKAHPGADPAI